MFLYQENFSLDEDAQDYIFALSNGHPGAVESILNILFQVCTKYLRKYFWHSLSLTIVGHVEKLYLKQEANNFRPIAMKPNMDLLEH